MRQNWFKEWEDQEAIVHPETPNNNCWEWEVGNQCNTMTILKDVPNLWTSIILVLNFPNAVTLQYNSSCHGGDFKPGDYLRVTS